MMRKIAAAVFGFGLIVAAAAPAQAGPLDGLLGGILPKLPIVRPPGPQPTVGAPGPVGGVFLGMPLVAAAGGLAYVLLRRRTGQQR